MSDTKHADFSWDRCEREQMSELAVIIPNAAEDSIVTYRDKPYMIPTTLIDDVSVDEVASEVQRMLQVSTRVVMRAVIYSIEKKFEYPKEELHLCRLVYVAELLENTDRLPDGLQWRKVDECLLSYCPEVEQRVINDELRIMATKEIPTRRLDCFRPGWFKRTELWLKEMFRSKGMEMEEPLEQVTMSWNSTVLKAVTSGGTFFVKYCAPHSLDPAVMAVLRDIAPDLVAEPLYLDVDKLMMVTADHGDSVRMGSVTHHDGIVLRICELHKASLGNVSRLEQTGLHKYTAEYLADNVDELIHEKLKFLDGDENLEYLKQNMHLIKEVIADLKRCDLPLVLVHHDLFMGNVYRTEGPEGRYQFFDFDSSFIANPLFDLDYVDRYRKGLYISTMGYGDRAGLDRMPRAVHRLEDLIVLFEDEKSLATAEECVRVMIQDCLQSTVELVALSLKKEIEM